MDRETVEALAEHLKQFISITEGPRIGMILPQTFKAEGCDHTFQKTIGWLETNYLDVDTSVRWLKRRGAKCDCEVLTEIVLRLDEEF